MSSEINNDDRSLPLGCRLIKCSTQFVSSLACSYQPSVEVNGRGNTLAYYNMATITSVKGFKVQAPVIAELELQLKKCFPRKKQNKSDFVNCNFWNPLCQLFQKSYLVIVSSKNIKIKHLNSKNFLQLEDQGQCYKTIPVRNLWKINKFHSKAETSGLDKHNSFS